jgi:hypothetical protein
VRAAGGKVKAPPFLSRSVGEEGGRGEGEGAPPFLSRSVGEEGGRGKVKAHPLPLPQRGRGRGQGGKVRGGIHICSHPNTGGICYTECTKTIMRRLLIA